MPNSEKNILEELHKADLTIEKCTLELKESREYRENSEERLKKCEEKSDFKNQLLTKEEFAELCRVTPITIHRRLTDGMYNRPEGCTEFAVFNQGQQYNALFRIPLAMEYFEMNSASK